MTPPPLSVNVLLPGVKGYRGLITQAHLRTSASNFAVWYSEQGKYGEAATLCRRAFDGRKDKLGPDHPESLAFANNLASLQCKRGQYDEAAALYRYALAGWEKTFGILLYTNYKQ